MSKGNFSFDTIDEFDKHIDYSIPRYKDVHTCIDGLVQYFIRDGVRIMDLGCSTGTLLKRIDEAYDDKDLDIEGVDRSANLLPANTGRCTFSYADLTSPEFYIRETDIVFSIFTLCFIPLPKREELVRKVYLGLNPGGVLISTDKIRASSAVTQDMFTFLYYDFKRQHFTEQEILDKEISLREIQRPISAEENEVMFRRAGFEIVEPFWKYYNFEGWVCVK